MDNVVSMIASNQSASSIADKIQDMLYAKTIEKIEELRPAVYASVFGEDESSEDEN